MANQGWGSLSSVQSAITTGLDALANNARAISAALNHTALDPQPPLSHWELTVDWVSAPTAGSVVDLYLLPSIDGGSTFADGDASITPQQHLKVGSFEVRNVTPAQKMILRDIPLPAGQFKALLINGSGQAFPASGSLLEYVYFYPESV